MGLISRVSSRTYRKKPTRNRSKMVVGKNKRLNLKGKKGKGKKVVDPFTKKDWYDIKAPAVFKNRQVGKTLVTKTIGNKIAADGLKHRVYDINQEDLNGHDGNAHRVFQLVREDVQGKNCMLNFHGMRLTRDKNCESSLLVSPRKTRIKNASPPMLNPLKSKPSEKSWSTPSLLTSSRRPNPLILWTTFTFKRSSASSDLSSILVDWLNCTVKVLSRLMLGARKLNEVMLMSLLFLNLFNFDDNDNRKI